VVAVVAASLSSLLIMKLVSSSAFSKGFASPQPAYAEAVIIVAVAFDDAARCRPR
jgi:hypothetical protein